MTRAVLLLVIILGGDFISMVFYKHYTDIERPEYVGLRCDKGEVYPLQFLLIFALDVVSAIVDLIIFIVSPKIENKRKLLKQARMADIEGSIHNRQTRI